jgi:S-adenosylmethionine hydrolase
VAEDPPSRPSPAKGEGEVASKSRSSPSPLAGEGRGGGKTRRSRPRPAPIIALFTDFGLAGPYTGQMKAVLHLAAPGIVAIDLFADAPSRNPKAASYLLAAYSHWFPPGTVFLSVVDPGVGGARAPVIVAADDRWFVGPDNGLFEIVKRRAVTAPREWEITWRPAALSPSFHGRDLFAPVAARVAQGEIPGALRDPAPSVRADWPDDLAEIVYIDHYGNAMTGLRANVLPADARLEAGEKTLPPARTFSSVPEGAAFWYENSTGLAEIAVNGGRADAALALRIGSKVCLVTS